MSKLQPLVEYIKANLLQLAVIVSLDIRNYNLTHPEFEIVRNSLSKFTNLLKNASTTWFVTQDHGTELKNVAAVVSSELPKHVLDATPSAYCYCGHLQASFFSFCDGCFKIVPQNKKKLVINLLYANDYSSVNNYANYSHTLKNSGCIVANLVIKGHPDLKKSASEGFFFDFPSAESFKATIDAIDCNLPADKPIVTKQQLGSDFVKVLISYQYANASTKYIIEAMHVGKQSTFTKVGEVVGSDTFELDVSNKAFKLQAYEEYKLRVKATSTSGDSNWGYLCSEFVNEGKKEQRESFMTLKAEKVYEKITQSANLDNGTTKYRNELKNPVCIEAITLGQKCYNFLMFGDIGAGMYCSLFVFTYSQAKVQLLIPLCLPSWGKWLQKHKLELASQTQLLSELVTTVFVTRFKVSMLRVYLEATWDTIMMLARLLLLSRDVFPHWWN